MPVKKEPNGRRSVQAEVEVPGTPEEVWSAIATGPGVTSWFVPTRVEERVGGKLEACFGPQMDSLAEVSTWDPPRRFVAESRDETGPGGPAIATEWVVEARSGGTCVVRVVHSWFASTDDWDNQFEGHSQGWIAFFRSLRLYLTYFRGQHAQCMQLLTPVALPPARAFEKLTRALNLGAPKPGERAASHDAPKLEGTVEHVGPEAYPELSLRLTTPAPGIAHMFALGMGPQTFLCVRLYLFGKTGREQVAREERSWQQFLQTTFSAA
jgi:uncharacterized protein YndB with AHSA1/START domain